MRHARDSGGKLGNGGGFRGGPRRPPHPDFIGLASLLLLAQLPGTKGGLLDFSWTRHLDAIYLISFYCCHIRGAVRGS